MGTNEDKDLDPQKRSNKGRFQKGNKPAPKNKKQSPITATACKEHYEQICKWAKQGLLEPREMLTLFKFEHDSMYGTPVQRVAQTDPDGKAVGVDRPRDDRAAWLLRNAKP